MFKKLKQKRCSNCKYYFKTESLNCCERPDKYNLKLLRPLKLLCFGKKTKGVEHENNETRYKNIK